MRGERNVKAKYFQKEMTLKWPYKPGGLPKSDRK